MKFELLNSPSDAMTKSIDNLSQLSIAQQAYTNQLNNVDTGLYNIDDYKMQSLTYPNNESNKKNCNCITSSFANQDGPVEYGVNKYYREYYDPAFPTQLIRQ